MLLMRARGYAAKSAPQKSTVMAVAYIAQSGFHTLDDCDRRRPALAVDGAPSDRLDAESRVAAPRSGGGLVSGAAANAWRSKPRGATGGRGRQVPVTRYDLPPNRGPRVGRAHRCSAAANLAEVPAAPGAGRRGPARCRVGVPSLAAEAAGGGHIGVGFAGSRGVASGGCDSGVCGPRRRRCPGPPCRAGPRPAAGERHRVAAVAPAVAGERKPLA
jgi:hypothetical protein